MRFLALHFHCTVQYNDMHHIVQEVLVMGVEQRIKANRALYAVLLDVRLTGCRLRIIRITPWFRTALKAAGAGIFE